MGTTARIVTLHELDDEQVHKVEGNHAYNLADAIIVHDTNLKKQLIEYGVKGDLIHVVCCGTDLDDVEDESVRDGIVFYGGHRLNNSKGIDVLLSSYAMLKDSHGDVATVANPRSLWSDPACSARTSTASWYR